MNLSPVQKEIVRCMQSGWEILDVFKNLDYLLVFKKGQIEAKIASSNFYDLTDNEIISFNYMGDRGNYYKLTELGKTIQL